MEDAVRFIGHALAAMGPKEPQINSEGELDIHLEFQYRSYSKQDSPNNCVKPLPVQVLLHIDSIAAASADQDLKAISDMIHLEYFFLLRPV